MHSHRRDLTSRGPRSQEDWRVRLTVSQRTRRRTPRPEIGSAAGGGAGSGLRGPSLGRAGRRGRRGRREPGAGRRGSGTVARGNGRWPAGQSVLPTTETASITPSEARAWECGCGEGARAGRRGLVFAETESRVVVAEDTKQCVPVPAPRPLPHISTHLLKRRVVADKETRSSADAWGIESAERTGTGGWPWRRHGGRVRQRRGQWGQHAPVALRSAAMSAKCSGRRWQGGSTQMLNPAATTNASPDSLHNPCSSHYALRIHTTASCHARPAR